MTSLDSIIKIEERRDRINKTLISIDILHDEIENISRVIRDLELKKCYYPITFIKEHNQYELEMYEDRLYYMESLMERLQYLF